MITIYGSPRSSSGRCFWTLEEVGAEYANKPVDFKANEHKSEEFLKVNPNGKVPVLVDGDFSIWESMGINLYLAEKYKPELLGTTPEQKGLSYQWSIWSIGELQPPLIEAFIQLVFVPEERRSEEVIEKAKAKLPSLLNTIDTTLCNSKYLAGSVFTLADLNTASVVEICDLIGYSLEEYKNISAWRGAISERPAFAKYKKLCE